MATQAVIGEIRMFAGNFGPRGWALCQGQILSIAQNTALFSILGVTFGGDGKTTFALPDLRGRTPVGTDQGPGLSPYVLGEMDGVTDVTLIQTDVPPHNHQLQGANAAGNNADPTGRLPARPAPSGGYFKATGGTPVTMNPQAVGVAGKSQPHSNQQPYVGMNFIICLEGIFPSRN